MFGDKLRATCLEKVASLGEVPVHGALADTGALGHRAEGQGVPVPGVELVDELGAGGDDALTGLGGLPAPHRAVVPTALTVGGRA